MPLRLSALFWFVLFFGFVTDVSAQTLLLIRHGEKPVKGLGELNCQGLNRALALPKVIEEKFGVADTLIAPDPSVVKSDKGIEYAYVRPLATLTPMAAHWERPIETFIAFNDLVGLEARFNKALQEGPQLTLVAWEHKIAEQVVKNLFEHHRVQVAVPHWEDDDFDSIYVITRNSGGQLSFERQSEGLKHLSEKCPRPR